MSTSKYREILGLGKIPEDWEVVSLGEIAEIKGRIGWHGLRDEDYQKEGEYYLVRGIDLENGKINWEKCVYISKEWYERDPNIQLKEGDLLITKDGSIGKIAFVDYLPKRATLGTGIFRIRTQFKKYIPEFLYYIFESNYFVNFINRLKAGSTLAHLYQKDLVNFSFPLPPLEEQQKIAEILSTVDGVIQKVDKIIAKTERLKKGLMQKLLTRGIGHREFKYSKELGCEIPKEWKVVKLEDIAERTRNSFVDGPFGSDLKKEEFIPSGIPVIQLHNVADGLFIPNQLKYISEKKFNELKRHETYPGDIVITKLGDPIARACVIPNFYEKYMIVADCVRLRVNREVAYPRYVVQVINSKVVRKQAIARAKGTTRKRINLAEIRKLKIPLPPLPEQQKIASILSTVDKKLEIHKNYKKKLERVKKQLMNDLLTGKKRVKVDKDGLH